MRALFATLCLALFVGCAGVGHLTTPSGKPEVVVTTSVAQAQKECLAWLLQNGYMVGEQRDTKDVVLQGEKDVTSGLHKVFPGNQDVERVLFNFLTRDSNVTIYANKGTLSTRMGEKNVQSQSYSENNTQDDMEYLQTELNKIKSAIEGRSH